MMHRSTRIIAGIELASLLFVITVGFLFQSATLRAYAQAGVLGFAVVAGIVGLGWAKPRGADNKIASAVLISSAVVYQITLFVLLGIKLGFVANIYRFGLTSIMQVWFPLILMIVFTEILRGQMISRGRESRGVILMTAIVLSLLEIAVLMPAYLPLTAQSGCELVMAAALPIILTNILLTYIAYRYDYRANIAYRLVMELPIYFLPIYPDLDVYHSAVFNILLVVTLVVAFIHHRKLDEPAENKSQLAKWQKRTLDDQQRKRLRYFGYTVAGISLAGFLGFCGLMSGLFHHFFLAIESDSMEPEISRGDLVLVEKTDTYSEITDGTVLVYRNKNLVVVHRVSEVSYDGKKYQYKTKGDANMNEDVWVVEQQDVIGVAKNKISLFGYPTVWLNELFNGGK